MIIDNLTILAIAPGTREIGWAILQSRETLLHCGVRTITKRHYLQVAKMESGRFVESLIDRYEPRFLAIEKRCLVQKSSGLLTAISRETKVVSQTRGLIILEYVSTAVRKRLCPAEKVTKKDVSQLLAYRFPELKNYLRYENKWSELYYTKMFDAVGVGLVCYEDISVKSQSNL